MLQPTPRSLNDLALAHHRPIVPSRRSLSHISRFSCLIATFASAPGLLPLPPTLSPTTTTTMLLLIVPILFMMSIVLLLALLPAALVLHLTYRFLLIPIHRYFQPRLQTAISRQPQPSLQAPPPPPVSPGLFDISDDDQAPPLLREIPSLDLPSRRNRTATPRPPLHMSGFFGPAHHPH